MLAFFNIFGMIEKRGKYNTKECSMKKFWNQIFRNLLAAIVAGLCYAGFAYWENGTVEFLTVLGLTGVNFVLLCLLCLIAPPLRRLLGHDKKVDI